MILLICSPRLLHAFNISQWREESSPHFPLLYCDDQIYYSVQTNFNLASIWSVLRKKKSVKSNLANSWLDAVCSSLNSFAHFDEEDFFQIESKLVWNYHEAMPILRLSPGSICWRTWQCIDLMYGGEVLNTLVQFYTIKVSKSCLTSRYSLQNWIFCSKMSSVRSLQRAFLIYAS